MDRSVVRNGRCGRDQSRLSCCKVTIFAFTTVLAGRPVRSAPRVATDIYRARGDETTLIVVPRPPPAPPGAGVRRAATGLSSRLDVPFGSRLLRACTLDFFSTLQMLSEELDGSVEIVGF